MNLKSVYCSVLAVCYLCRQVSNIDELRLSTKFPPVVSVGVDRSPVPCQGQQQQQGGEKQGTHRYRQKHTELFVVSFLLSCVSPTLYHNKQTENRTDCVWCYIVTIHPTSSEATGRVATNSPTLRTETHKIDCDCCCSIVCIFNTLSLQAESHLTDFGSVFIFVSILLTL